MISNPYTHSHPLCCDRAVVMFTGSMLHMSRSIIQRGRRVPSALQGNIAAITRNGPFVTVSIACCHQGKKKKNGTGITHFNALTGAHEKYDRTEMQLTCSFTCHCFGLQYETGRRRPRHGLAVKGSIPLKRRWLL